MELIIDQPDALGLYPWVLKYDNKDVLDAYLRSNNLITDFEVLGSQLTFHYEKQEEGIAIQVFSSLANQYSLTGDEIIASDTIPPVKSFVVNGYQKGFLKKIK